ncbi:hypothetical protein [Nocardia sp. NPDC020380]|uniref:hypothetical protein n=1 Tax=Nocardia sp. NPDC020380 TaxID=3364309 RepID=UPI0037BAD9C1
MQPTTQTRRGRAADPCAVLADIAARTAEPRPIAERARSVLAALRDLVPYECAALSAWDPISGVYRPVVNAGYSPPIFAAIHSELRRDEHARLGLLDQPLTVRFRDLPGGGRDLTSYRVVAPAGFREGLGSALFTRDGRHAGSLSLSTTNARYPSARQRDLVALLAPTLAGITDAVGAVCARHG